MQPINLRLLLSCLFLLPHATSAFEYRIGVGKDETTGRKGIGFDPSSIHPAAGDIIAFEFRSGVHSVVQSTFENPCVGNGGFNSGVFTVDDSLPVDAPGLPIVTLNVNDTNPLWFFDEAGGECYKGGIFSVNPTLDQTPAAFKANAAKPPVYPSSSSTASDNASTSASSTAPAGQPSKTTGAAIIRANLSIQWSTLAVFAIALLQHQLV